jgi:hypothetical protein
MTLLLALLALAATAPDAAADPAKAYRACPGQDVLQKAANVGWRPAASQLQAHRELRTKLKAPLPEGPRRILWFASGGDLATTTFSVVVVREAGGLWHSTAVGQNQIWIKDTPPTVLPPMDRVLTAEDSRRLDALLADPCLYAGPTFLRDPNIVAGGLSSTLEIEAPEHRWIGTWHVLPTKQEADIIALIGDR